MYSYDHRLYLTPLLDCVLKRVLIGYVCFPIQLNFNENYLNYINNVGACDRKFCHLLRSYCTDLLLHSFIWKKKMQFTILLTKTVTVSKFTLNFCDQSKLETI